MSESLGPYMNEDGDWWVPVARMKMRDAKRAVEGCADSGSRIVYAGRETVPLTDHEYGCQCEPTCYVDRDSWHFREVER